MTMPLPVFTSMPTDPDLERVFVLSRQLESANVEYDRMDRYYTGDQPMTYFAPEIRAQLGSSTADLVINWPETIVDSVNRRLRVEGFTVGEGGETDDELWRIWTANDLEEESPLGISDALVHGLSFLSVWGNDDDPATPSITYESAHQVTVDYEPGNRTVRSGLKRWQDGDTTYATLYLPDRIVRFAARGSTTGVPGRYEVDQELPNPLGAVPIVPVVNRGRLLNRAGRSELKSVAPIADSINELANGMMTTGRFYITPRRYVTGMQVSPDPAQRERMRAEMEAFWERAEASKFLVAGDGAQFGQFPEADLAGFVSGIHLLTAALAAIGGLPPDDLGLNTTNPASAEARRAAETTLILRAKEKWRPFGGAKTRAMRLAIAARDGVPVRAIPQEYSRMAVSWADPATPAIAQAMDAAVKGVEAGIYDAEAAQISVGMSAVERSALKQRAAEADVQQTTNFQKVGLPALVEAGIVSPAWAAEQVGAPTEGLSTVATPTGAASPAADPRRAVELARELQERDGLSRTAALAAAGLTQAARADSAESGA